MWFVFEKFNYYNVDDLLVGLGYGEIILNLVVNRLWDVFREVIKVEENLDICLEKYLYKFI